MHSSGPAPVSPALPFLTPLAPVQRPAASATTAALTGPTAAPPSAPGPIPQATAPVAGTPPAISAPPPGANPALWSVLTPDEQQFFQQMAALGQLTYGARPSQAAPDAPVGQRLDVRG